MWKLNTWQRAIQPALRTPGASRHLSEAENIIVIGYSLPESDQFFRYLFALGTVGDSRPQRFWVIDPDRSGEVAERFHRLLGPSFESRFRFFKVLFSDGISQVEENLRLVGKD